MRAFLMIVSLSALGCFAEATHGRTTTSHTKDDGISPVQHETWTQESSGQSIGGNMPLMMGGNGLGGGGYIGPGGMVVAGASTTCVLYPDRCAGVYTATIVQPVTVVSSGGGYVTRGGGRQAAGTSSGDSDDSELSELLHKHEEALTALAGGGRQNVRQLCQILVANPAAIPDPDERKEVVDACKAGLAKTPYQKKKEAK